MFDHFLKIDGIEGESVHAGYRGAIELESFTWGEQQGPGKVELRDVEFTAQVSRASPRLLRACASGEHFDKAEIQCAPQTSGSPTVFRLIFTGVLVAAYEVNGQQSGPPVERVRLLYGKVECEYRMRRADGSLGEPIRGGFDAVGNQPLPPALLPARRSAGKGRRGKSVQAPG